MTEFEKSGWVSEKDGARSSNHPLKEEENFVWMTEERVEEIMICVSYLDAKSSLSFAEMGNLLQFCWHSISIKAVFENVKLKLEEISQSKEELEKELEEFSNEIKKMEMREKISKTKKEEQEKLESVLQRPVNYYGSEQEKNIFRLAGRYIEAIAVGHPYDNYNKRIAMYTVEVFLISNGYVQRNVDEDEVKKDREILKGLIKDYVMHKEEIKREEIVSYYQARYTLSSKDLPAKLRQLRLLPQNISQLRLLAQELDLLAQELDLLAQNLPLPPQNTGELRRVAQNFPLLLDLISGKLDLIAQEHPLLVQKPLPLLAQELHWFAENLRLFAQNTGEPPLLAQEQLFLLAQELDLITQELDLFAQNLRRLAQNLRRLPAQNLDLLAKELCELRQNESVQKILNDSQITPQTSSLKGMQGDSSPSLLPPG